MTSRTLGRDGFRTARHAHFREVDHERHEGVVRLGKPIGQIAQRNSLPSVPLPTIMGCGCAQTNSPGPSSVGPAGRLAVGSWDHFRPESTSGEQSSTGVWTQLTGQCEKNEAEWMRIIDVPRKLGRCASADAWRSCARAPRPCLHHVT